MKKRLDQLGRFFLRTTIFIMVAVVVLQGAMTLGPMDLFMGWPQRMAGEDTWMVNALYVSEQGDKDETQSVALQQTSVTLALKEVAALPYCRVLVNGETAACFQEKEVQLLLSAGDHVEVDATYYNFPVQIEVQEGAENLLYPRVKQCFEVQKGIVWIGEIQTKS